MEVARRMMFSSVYSNAIVGWGNLLSAALLNQFYTC
jgi:hypothetical protein